MKTLLALLLLLGISSASYAVDLKNIKPEDLRWRIVPGYGILLNPSLSGLDEKSAGGFNLIGQAYLKNDSKLKYGVETGYQYLYGFEKNLTFTNVSVDPLTAEVTSTPVDGKVKASVFNFPLNAVARYNFDTHVYGTRPFVLAIGGLNVLNYTVSGAGASTASTLLRLGFGIGAGVMFNLSDRITIEPALRLNMIFARETITTLNLGLGVAF